LATGVPARSPFVTVLYGIALVLACPILLAVIGGLVAMALNHFVPGYYQAYSRMLATTMLPVLASGQESSRA
jgi:hypothetical protein